MEMKFIPLIESVVVKEENKKLRLVGTVSLNQRMIGNECAELQHTYILHNLPCKKQVQLFTVSGSYIT